MIFFAALEMYKLKGNTVHIVNSFSIKNYVYNCRELDLVYMNFFTALEMYKPTGNTIHIVNSFSIKNNDYNKYFEKKKTTLGPVPRGLPYSIS